MKLSKTFICLSLMFFISLIICCVYLWQKYETQKLREVFCSKAEGFNKEQLYQRAMGSYFQGIKDNIVHEKNKEQDFAPQNSNAFYNLFILKENIKNFYDLQKNLKMQIENPDNTYNSNKTFYSHKDMKSYKTLDENLLFIKISYGSVVVWTSLAKIQDNIGINEPFLYHQLNNRYSFLFTVESGGDQSRQIFYPLNCCRIISYQDVVKVRQNKLKQNKNQEIKDYMPEVPKAKYFLLISNYSYKINMNIIDMKYQPLKEIYSESNAYPIDECGMIQVNSFFHMKKLSMS